MSCAKRQATGHCRHFQCPYASQTDHGYECVELISGPTSQICEVGEGCVEECPFSFKPDDAEAAEVVRIAFNEYISDQLMEHGAASEEEIALFQEAEEFDRTLCDVCSVDMGTGSCIQCEEFRAKKEYHKAKDAHDLAVKERKEMEVETAVHNFMVAHPIGMLHGIVDYLFHCLEKDGGLPEGQSLEHLENAVHNLILIVDAVKEDAK